MSISTPARIAFAVLALGATAQPAHAQYDAPVRVPKSVLEKYVGEWVYPAGNSIRAVVKGDTLFREVSGQRFAYTPISGTRFWVGPVFTAEFVTDQTGALTQVLSDGIAVEYRLVRKTDGPATSSRSAAGSVKAETAAVHVRRSLLER